MHKDNTRMQKCKSFCFKAIFKIFHIVRYIYKYFTSRRLQIFRLYILFWFLVKVFLYLCVYSLYVHTIHIYIQLNT